MKRVALLPLLACALAGCSSESSWGYEPNEIVFGIRQSLPTDAGTVETVAGYDLIGLGGRGSAPLGLVDRGRSCWVEDLEARLGQPRVEGGVARFQGGRLPVGGLAILGSDGTRESETTFPSAGWSGPSDVLAFDARGFAMPDVGPVRLTAPSTSLALTEPAASGDVAVPAADLTVRWEASTPAVGESVMVTFEAEPQGERRLQARCFFERSAGSGVVPSSVTRVLARGAKAPVRGVFRVATHRQVTVFSKGGWIVYVVAVADQRLQPFVLAAP